jgi:hypothetical protein
MVLVITPRVPGNFPAESVRGPPDICPARAGNYRGQERDPVKPFRGTPGAFWGSMINPGQDTPSPYGSVPHTAQGGKLGGTKVYGVALFVHKCMKIADAAAVAAARQQPR